MTGAGQAHFAVPRMHCAGCAEAVRDALSEVEGVRRIDVDLRRRELSVAWDPERTSEEAVRGRLDEAGFPACAAGRCVDASSGRGAAARLAALAVALVAVGALGYTAYATYPRFDLPALDLGPLLLLAVGAGVTSFFSPCAFALLAALLGREVREAPGLRPAPVRAAGFAVAMSAGAALFLLLLGGVIALGGGALVGSVTFTSSAGRLLRLGVGAALVLLGLVQLGRLPLPLHSLERGAKPLMRAAQRPRERRSFPAFFLFGFGYLLAGFG